MNIKQLTKMLLTVLLTALLFTGNAAQLHATEYPVQVNGKGYASLQEAVKAISATAESDAEKTVKLLADLPLYEDWSIPEDKTVILDLNNHIISMNQYRIINNGGLTITDSAENPTEKTFNYYRFGISNNETISGGVLYGGGNQSIINNKDLKIEKGYIYACGAPAVYNAVSGYFAIVDGYIVRSGRYSSEDNYAGGVENAGTFIMCGGEISGNDGNLAGGVYNASTGIFTMEGGKISDNFNSSCNAGGIYNDGTFVMKDGSIENNFSGLNAGGVYNAGVFTLSGGEIKNNECFESAGGVYNRYGKTFEMKGGTISGNISGDEYYTGGTNHGGGVYNGGTFTFSGGEIKENVTYEYGAGVYNDSNSVFEMKDGTISNNEAKDNTSETASGGGVYNKGNFVLTDGSINGNSCFHDGGGVYNDSNSVFEMKGGTIKRNVAEDCYDTSQGGGVYNHGTMTMTGGIIEENSSSCIGGGVANYSIFTLDGGSINNNSSVCGAIGVYNGSSATFNMKSGTISNNVTYPSGYKPYGGGVKNDGTMNFSGGTISNNSSYYGAGISNDGTIEMIGGIIEKNSAEYGSGIYISKGVFTLTNGEIKENNSESIAGGVYVESCGVFLMKGGKIIGNTTDGDNSAIYLLGTAEFSGGSITGNKKMTDNVGEGLDFGSVYVSSNATIYLKGDIVIKDNLNYHNEQCNLFLENYDYGFDIDEHGTFSENAEIHVTLRDVNNPFIEGLEKSTDAKYFIPDDSDYGVKAIEGSENYDVYLKHKYSICYSTQYGETPVDSNKYMEGEEIELPVTSAPISFGYKASGWQLYNDAYYASDGMTRYTVSSLDADDGYTIYLYQSIVPIITDINGKEGGENSVTRMTVNEADDINYHITAISYYNLYDRNDLSNSVKVWVDENDNGNFDSDEELTYGEDFDVSAGSVNVTLKKEYLNTLELGNHKVHIQITIDRPENYDFETSIKVSKKAEESVYRVVNTCTK